MCINLCADRQGFRVTSMWYCASNFVFHIDKDMTVTDRAGWFEIWSCC